MTNKTLEDLKRELYEAFDKAMIKSHRFMAAGGEVENGTKLLGCASKIADSIVNIEREQREAELQRRAYPHMNKEIRKD